MKWRIFCLMMLCCACRKDENYNRQFSKAEDLIEGKWKLVQYYRDDNDGTGQWVSTDTANVQIIQFTGDGKFSHNANFVIQESIDRYKFLDAHKVLLYSSHASDSANYFYQQDQFPELIFNPFCKEFSCMRKFARVQ